MSVGQVLREFGEVNFNPTVRLEMVVSGLLIGENSGFQTWGDIWNNFRNIYLSVLILLIPHKILKE